jgi:hypothetical protein
LILSGPAAMFYVPSAWWSEFLRNRERRAATHRRLTRRSRS